ncbi:UDP-glucoronosyl and UDP-glucosyl transferase [Musa troglodytarum]|uniref:UDP-glucoronosyl and UDP-glucosyl transferase n=1 Tax=Musa troglodytarum TaxID=320322 RepID=A0A9E7JX49_9LILI|nr:UDP-glucoronosyl and UDP-glucosyl transferase [Musa troglodytarum]
MEAARQEEAQDVAVVVVPLPAQSHLAQLHHFALLLCGRPGLSVHFATSATHIRQAKSRVNPAWGGDSRLHFHELPIPAFPSPPPDRNSTTTRFPAHLQPMFDAFEHLDDPLSALLRSLSASSRRVVVVHDLLASFAAVKAAALHNAESYTFRCLPALFQLVYERPSVADELRDRGLALPPSDGIVTEKFGAFAKRRMDENTASAGTLLNTCRPIEGEFIDLLAREPKHRDRKIFTVGPLSPMAVIDGGRRRQPHECLYWLDKQPPASVVYVSFGTTTAMTDEQTEVSRRTRHSVCGRNTLVRVSAKADDGVLFCRERRPRAFRRVGSRHRRVLFVHSLRALSRPLPHRHFFAAEQFAEPEATKAPFRAAVFCCHPRIIFTERGRPRTRRRRRKGRVLVNSSFRILAMGGAPRPDLVGTAPPGFPPLPKSAASSAAPSEGASSVESSLPGGGFGAIAGQEEPEEAKPGRPRGYGCDGSEASIHKRRRGGPPGSRRLAGVGFTPHVMMMTVGEEVVIANLHRSPYGRVIGGLVSGSLIAAKPVQVQRTEDGRDDVSEHQIKDQQGKPFRMPPNQDITPKMKGGLVGPGRNQPSVVIVSIKEDQTGYHFHLCCLPSSINPSKNLFSTENRRGGEGGKEGKLLYQWSTSWVKKNSASDGGHPPAPDETSHARKPSVVYTCGPCGGAGGGERDMGADPGTRILKVMVRHGLAVDAIRIMYRRDGRDEWTDWWGGRGGQLAEIVLDDERDEYLAWISGRYGICGGYLVIRSLTFASNKRTYGPFGVDDGAAPFKLDGGGQRIVGFFARAGHFLDAIGVYTA